ncbi:MAG TPA: M3 family metallopeptidase [Casimicrobiaceae bacterium]|nr:M3 family metallopeptidase [Casimicrobiaceae bacterium]
MNSVEQIAAVNPLLDFSGLPRFADIRPEHVAPAVDALLGEARATIERVATAPGSPTWDSFVQPLSDALDRLGRAWTQVGHLNAVVNTPELRVAYNQNLPKVTAFYTELGQDERLFARYRMLAASPGFAAADPARRRVVDNALRDFRLSGAELAAAPKARFKAIEEELASLSSRFADNLLDATNAFALYVEDASRLAGMPADVVAAARAAAQTDGKPGWKLTLHMPSYLPVLQYADDRGLRETLYRANATRASEFGKPEWDNGPLVDTILALRDEAAALLGYKSYAEVSLVPKMARSPAEVIDFLHDLARRAKPYAERDMAELAEFARERLGLPELAAWDLLYASEKLREARYSYSDEEVKQYFSVDRVLSGMFGVVETLYGITVRAATAPAWDPAVRFFELTDRAGATVGQFYLDLFARPGKRGGAWMDVAIKYRRTNGRAQHPVAFLVCNFAAPVAGRPALFTHREVTTLFHEFGHGLHLLLTRVDVPGASGIEGVEWDAVELPSQFMENFCWEHDVVAQMSAHVETGEPLPRRLFDRLLAARNFQSGLQTVRQLEFALFDMHVHHDADRSVSPLALAWAVRREVAVVPRPDYDRSLPQGFSHVFAGGYAAGYYSYKWAEVLSADAYSLFEEQGVLSASAGARFRDEILARGGSRPALDSFVAFRGRKPEIGALLRHNGMLAS